MSILNDQQKLDLHNLIKTHETVDCTQEIRQKKQSQLIRNDITNLVMLKQKYNRLAKSNPIEFDNICVKQCSFLFNNYTDIYNKIKNDNMNLDIMHKLLDILKRIEDSEIDQHEGSYLVGKLLKELYVDSALRQQHKQDNKYRKKNLKKPSNAQKQITYKEFKMMNL